MNHLSPMMERVRRYGFVKKPKIPRKGRIRFVLLIIFFGIIVWVKFCGNADTAEPDTAAKKVNEENIQTPKTKKAANEITAATISRLIGNKESAFHLPFDTIRDLNRTFIVHNTIDSMLQKHSQVLMKRYKPKYGAIVAIDPLNGRILSLLSWKHDSVPSLGGNLYRKGVFPAASIFKTITAAAAIETAGFTSKTTIKHTGRNHTLYKFQLEPELNVYDDILFEDAYAKSINPAFGRIGLFSLKKGTLLDFSKRFGFNTDIPFELPVEISQVHSPDSNFAVAELASGFNQKTTLSPILGALIASAISENGRMPQPHIVDSISEHDSTIYRAEQKLWKIAVKNETAQVVKDLMIRVVRYGTARKSFSTIKKSKRFNDIEYGGKTGSVDKDTTGRVDWFIGFARHPEDKRQRIAVGVVTVHGAYWTVHSSYIGAEIMRVYLRAIQIEDEKKKKEAETDTVFNS